MFGSCRRCSSRPLIQTCCSSPSAAPAALVTTFTGRSALPPSAREQVSTFYQPCSVRGQHAALLSHDVALWIHPAALRGHRATPSLEPIMPPSAAKSLPPRTCCSPLETSCCPPKLSFRPQQQQRPAQYRCPSFPWSDRRRAHDVRKVRIIEQGKRKEIQLTQEATKEVHSRGREP